MPVTLRTALFLLFAGPLPFLHAEPDVKPLPDTSESLEVAPVWSGHPVGFALLTHGGFQYVAYYDAKRQLTVAQRRLEQRTWTYHPLPVTTGWDSHNYITLAVDDRGVLHLCGDMHASTLKYFRTKAAGDAATFERRDRMTGELEKHVTYPKFLTGARGELIFTYRDGGSGNGNQIFNVYDSAAREWTRLLDTPLTDGEGERNAYFDGPVRGRDGWFHLAWVWRESPDAATNHDLSYARSRDLRQWENGAGKPLRLPIKLGDGATVDPVPQQGGIINGNTKIGFDAEGRLAISYHKHDAAGNTQPWIARWEGERWAFHQTADWPVRWDFGGGGTLAFGIRLGSLKAMPDGRLTLTWEHFKFGRGTWNLDPVTLKALPKGKAKPVAQAVEKPAGAHPGMSPMRQADSGESGTPGLRYELRWETLPANRDRAPEGPLPEPSHLKVYAVSE